MEFQIGDRYFELRDGIITEWVKESFHGNCWKNIEEDLSTTTDGVIKFAIEWCKREPNVMAVVLRDGDIING